MKVTVIGSGYVGLIAGLGFANFGNQVICLDTDERKIQLLQNSVCPIYEPGAEELMRRTMKLGLLRFTTDKQIAICHGEIIFIAVGTPEGKNGEADLSYVFACAKDIGTYMESYKLVVDKSTVPVGTAQRVRETILHRQKDLGKKIEFDVASNPEFLREGRAVNDFSNPDRIVLGIPNKRAEQLLRMLYGTFNRAQKPVIVTDTQTAEMIKYASNAFLATKIAFINEMANLCEKTGANVQQVAYAMGKDGRISPKFLHAGPGFGGSCFPKDIKAIASLGRQMDAPLTIVESVITANQKQKQLSAEKILKAMPHGGNLAVLGLSFKPDTDDVRESPAIDILKRLHATGRFQLRLFDPQAMCEAQKVLRFQDDGTLIWCQRMEEALADCDAVAIITEWVQFTGYDWARCINNVRKKLFFDFRNIFLKDYMSSLGYIYFGTGIPD